MQTKVPHTQQVLCFKLVYPKFVIVDSSLLADNLINLFQRTEPNQNFNPSLPLFLKLSLNTQRS